ncbi:MAG: NADPH:quinone oxidoreductase family protein [Halobacteria archaeon]|nr:NADPH:quinone oxidoreductase family protein [Halobacteria archaeon]
MKAIRVTGFGGSDSLELQDVDEPEPGDDEVLIDVEAAGINFADIMQRRGLYPGGPQPPFVPGLEAAGTIEAVGENVNRDVGERVVAALNNGGYAEKVVADANSLFDIPESMNFEEAAAIPVQFLTAYCVLHGWGRLEEGEKVLVHAAAGGVGTAAVQLADIAGAEVFGTASTQEKLDLASRLGADHTINYTETEFADEVNDITDGEGVDLVLDGVGGDTFDSSFDCLAHFGRIVAYGVGSSEIPQVNTPNLFFGNYSVIGFHLGQAMNHDPGRVVTAIPELTKHFNEGELEVIVEHTFELEDAAEAHQSIEDRETTGKVVLKP